MMEARHLTKRYGDETAVDDLSFGWKPAKSPG
jgi:ABC-type multidrug transport system ATPase subunit